MDGMKNKLIAAIKSMDLLLSPTNDGVVFAVSLSELLEIIKNL